MQVHGQGEIAQRRCPAGSQIQKPGRFRELGQKRRFIEEIAWWRNALVSLVRPLHSVLGKLREGALSLCSAPVLGECTNDLCCTILVPFRTAALEKMEGWAFAVLLTMSSKQAVQRTEESHPPEGPQETATKVKTNCGFKDTVVRDQASEITFTV